MPVSETMKRNSLLSHCNLGSPITEKEGALTSDALEALLFSEALWSNGVIFDPCMVDFFVRHKQTIRSCALLMQIMSTVPVRNREREITKKQTVFSY